MKFRQRRIEDPEINLIPFIDVLLVILIFLMLSTTYSKFTELHARSYNFTMYSWNRLQEFWKNYTN